MICTITREEYDSSLKYTCLPEYANDEQCKNCKFYRDDEDNVVIKTKS